MARFRRILGLARAVIGLLVSLIGLIKLILSLVGGATNYARRCLARTITSSSCRRGSRYLSRRQQADRRAWWFMPKSGVGGIGRPISTIFGPAVTSQP